MQIQGCHLVYKGTQQLLYSTYYVISYTKSRVFAHFGSHTTAVPLVVRQQPFKQRALILPAAICSLVVCERGKSGKKSKIYVVLGTGIYNKAHTLTEGQQTGAPLSVYLSSLPSRGNLRAVPGCTDGPGESRMYTTPTTYSSTYRSKGDQPGLPRLLSSP